MPRRSLTPLVSFEIVACENRNMQSRKLVDSSLVLARWSIFMKKLRKVIVYIATSADGFIARADGAVEWLDRPRPKGNYGMGAFYNSIDTILWAERHVTWPWIFKGKA